MRTGLTTTPTLLAFASGSSNSTVAPALSTFFQLEGFSRVKPSFSSLYLSRLSTPFSPWAPAFLSSRLIEPARRTSDNNPSLRLGSIPVLQLLSHCSTP
eukprot:Gb_33224 [translate_table: standard]